MSGDTITPGHLLGSLIWACLDAPASKRPFFREVFSSQAVVSDVISTASLQYCDGFLDAANALNPPPVDWFTTTDTDTHNKWRVYALVLKRTDSKDLVYFGSGTQATVGVDARFQNYNQHVRLPKFVDKALNDGYAIIHKGLLVWSSIPPTGQIPIIRVLFVATEAALSFFVLGDEVL